MGNALGGWIMGQVEDTLIKPDCKYYGSAQGCKYGKKCHYSHDNPESVRLCRYISSAKGCRFGSRCRFRHAEYRKITSTNSSNTFDGAPDYEISNTLKMNTAIHNNEHLGWRARLNDKIGNSQKQYQHAIQHLQPEIIYLTDHLKCTNRRWTDTSKLKYKSFECHLDEVTYEKGKYSELELRLLEAVTHELETPLSIKLFDGCSKFQIKKNIFSRWDDDVDVVMEGEVIWNKTAQKLEVVTRKVFIHKRSEYEGDSYGGNIIPSSTVVETDYVIVCFWLQELYYTR